MQDFSHLFKRCTYTEEQFREAVRTSKTRHEIIKKLKMTGKATNYATINKKIEIKMDSFQSPINCYKKPGILLRNSLYTNPKSDLRIVSTLTAKALAEVIALCKFLKEPNLANFFY